MRKELKKIWDLIKDENGLETVEYAILLGLIVVASIALVVWLGGWVRSQFTSVQTTITGS